MSERRKPAINRGGRVEDALELFGGDEPRAGRGEPGTHVSPAGHPAPGPPPPAAPAGSTAETAIPVSLLTQTLKELVEGSFLPFWVRGEVTDFKAHRSGHWYFALRDATAQIRCVVWSRDQRGMPAAPDDGMQVTAFGRLAVYAARGDIQFTVLALGAAGDGLWRKALERTRARLEADGLLAPERKRSIPRFPARVAVITSPDGAALHDIVSVIRRRCASVEIVVVPARVQGDTAPDSLCAALARVTRWRAVDTVIIGRGGGGREDLWAFNDERVARAVAACPVPVISAVGHEVDITICDLVADLRAATPSAAAEAAVPERDALRAEVAALGISLGGAAQRRITRARQRLADTTQLLVRGAARSMERRRALTESAAGRLHALSPLATLSRGYAVARDDSGRTLSSAGDFAAGADFDLLLRDGTIRANVERVHHTQPRTHFPGTDGEPGR